MTDRKSSFSTLLVRTGLAVWIAAGVAVLAAAVRGGPAARAEPAAPVPRPVPATAAAASDSAGYVSRYALRTGDELVMVFVGASFCGAHRRPGFPALVEQAKLRMQADAQRQGKQFRALAVALDWEPDSALAFVRGFGSFDEMALGSNWVNDGALRYVWRDLPGRPVVPQVIVLERRVEAGESVRVTGERVRRRLLGVDEIEAWIRGGAAA